MPSGEYARSFNRNGRARRRNNCATCAIQHGVVRPSHQTSEFSSSPSPRREGRLFSGSALLAQVSALAQWRAGETAPLLAEPYRGVPLGVEAAWPTFLNVEAQDKRG